MKFPSVDSCLRFVLGGFVALQPVASHAQRVEPLLRTAPVVSRTQAGTARPELPRSVAWHAATERPTTAFLGPAWQAAIDTSTGVPARLWGPGIAAPGTVASPEAALVFARAFLGAHLATLAPGANLDDFVLAANDLDAGQRTVAFTQRRVGIPVLGGQLSLRFKNDRLFLISSQAVPVSGAPRAHAARLPAATLRDAAVRWVTTDVAPATAPNDALGPPSFLPVSADDGTIELRLVQAVVATVTGPTPDRFEVFVDATTGEPLARRSLLRRASGTLTFNAPVTHAGSGGSRMDYPARTLNVTLDGVSAETTADGGFPFATASAELVVSVAGRFVEVLTATGEPFTQTFTATDGAVLSVDERDDELADAQIAAYVHVNQMKLWARQVTNGSMPWLDEKLVVNTNLPNVCNAYYDGGSESVNFFQAGPLQGIACQNTALVADVIHHEFGHAFHDHAIIPGAGLFDYSLSEGIGDYVAATISGDPRMGRGFFAATPDVPMRHIDDMDRKIPDDIAPDVHTNGLIFAGAMWDLRKALVGSLGADGALVADRLLYQGIRRATDMPTTYLEVLAGDDDDGNLVNGTPHGCAITAAFAAHGLVPEGAYGTAGVQRPEIDGTSVVVQVRPSACPDAAITSLTVDVARRGVPGTEQTLTLEAPTTTPDADGFIRYEATLPFVPDGDVLQYRLTAALADGDVVRYPDNAADPYYEHFVGEVVPVACDSFDGGAYPRGYTHKLTGGDQGYGADEWMWGPPNASVYSGDPQAAYSGDNIFGTDLGGGSKEGWYAGLRSSRLSTPVTSLGPLAPNTRVRLQYRRWVALGAGDRVEIAANEHPVWSSVPPTSSAAIHRDREWRFHDVDVTDQIGEDGSLRIDFSIIADGTGEGGGWNIDDVCIVTAAAPTCTTADCADAAGCGCRTGSAGGGATSALLGVGIVLAIRRRRR
ncbi:MAG: MYXO-CTERM sorting domain-containing protein [Kofleriaceae bacterium]|nr:MYXO-CTERM sorting domain-containing protein [Kofleriaceae bacterium]